LKKLLKHPDHAGGGPAATMPVELSAAAALRQRVADFCELAKIRISVLVLLVTAVGFCLASPGEIDTARLLHAVLGTGLVAVAANTLNQVWERRFDALMQRTANRPIPAGRVGPREATVFGVACAACGLPYLWHFATPLAAAVAAVTLALYVLVYTPLKRRTVHNTLVGAVPGALPPVIGYAAAAGQMDLTALLLFAIVFVWQMPHFYAIAWMYRDDYARGGYRMLSVVDSTGAATGRQTMAYTVVLVAVSLLPAALGFAGPWYGATALALGIGLMEFARRLAELRSRVAARRMLLASVVYLPAIMLLLMMNRSL
jgi:protoheme IX farnesyltransferase